MKLVCHGGQELLLLTHPQVKEAYMEWSGLLDLVTVQYLAKNKGFKNSFLERWHEEMSSFHLPIVDMTITLNDDSCLLHLPVTDKPIDHVLSLTKTRWRLSLLLLSLIVARRVVEMVDYCIIIIIIIFWCSM